jgi:PAS domain S-box-containing protein
MPRAFSASDESVLLRLADQAAAAIHAGTLFVAEQTARREAEVSARRFQGLVDALDAIVLEADDTLRVTFVNRRVEEILGYPREQWYADPTFWATQIHPDDQDRTVAACRAAIAQDRDHVLEYRVRAADGRTVWLHDTVRVLPAGDDGRRRVRCVMLDITERKRAEAFLAGEREILARIAEGAPVAAVLDGLCRLIESQDPHLRASILLVAAGGRLRHGAAPSLPERYVRAIDGLVIGPVAGSCGTAAYLRKPVIVSDIATDPLWVAYRQFALPHGLRACWSSPVLDAAGEVMATFTVYHAEPRPPRAEEIELVHRASQITRIALERERVIVALKASEERHRALLTHIPAVTWLADAGGRILFVSPNAMRIVGYTAEELLAGGRDVWLDRVHRDDAAAVRAAFEALASRRASFDVEYRMRHKGGRWIWIRDRAVSSYEHDGVVYVTGVCTDITERKQAEAVRSRLLRQVVQVQEAERERLARELHDETAQSLAALLIGLQRLPAAPTAADARRQIARLHEVATRVLAEVGRMARALRPRALDVLGLLPALERFAAELGEMRGLAITVQAAGLEGQRLPPEVEITLYRIMQEALSNVARHAGASKAAVMVERRAAVLTMTVVDDGRGFDVKTALRATDERTGVGLHGIRERAAVLRGTVEFLSEPGHGTRVVVEIPLPADAP